MKCSFICFFPQSNSETITGLSCWGHFESVSAVVSRLPCSVGQFDGKNISQLKAMPKWSSGQKGNICNCFIAGMACFFNCTVVYNCAEKLVEILIYMSVQLKSVPGRSEAVEVNKPLECCSFHLVTRISWKPGYWHHMSGFLKCIWSYLVESQFMQ